MERGPREVTSSTSGGDAAAGYLGFLRAAARIAVLAGAVGSVALLLRAGRSTPRLLLVLFVVWVLSPFVALAWADLVAKRWALLTRATLYWVTLAVTLGSLAIYCKLGLRPSGSPRTPVFVAVPPASWLLIAIAVPMAALLSRRRSQRGAAA
jgi:hypothetical protein